MLTNRTGRATKETTSVYYFVTIVTDRTYLCAEPQLPGEVLLEDVFGELHAEVPVRPFAGDEHVHNGVGNRQDAVLRLPQLVHEGSATFRIFPSIETIQFARYHIQGFVRKEELRQQRRIILLQ